MPDAAGRARIVDPDCPNPATSVCHDRIQCKVGHAPASRAIRGVMVDHVEHGTLRAAARIRAALAAWRADESGSIRTDRYVIGLGVVAVLGLLILSDVNSPDPTPAEQAAAQGGATTTRTISSVGRVAQQPVPRGRGRQPPVARLGELRRAVQLRPPTTRGAFSTRRPNRPARRRQGPAARPRSPSPSPPPRLRPRSRPPARTAPPTGPDPVPPPCPSLRAVSGTIPRFPFCAPLPTQVEVS